MTVLVSDSFNRADSATGLGTTDSYNGGTATSWANIIGVMGISTNQAYDVNGTTDTFSVVNAGQSDVSISVTIPADNNRIAGIYLRSTDSNNWIRVVRVTNAIYIQKRVSGTQTTLLNKPTTLANNDVLNVQANGSTISVYNNGTLIGTVTETFNQTVTNHGIGVQGSTSYTSVRFDNFEIDSLGTGGTGTTLTVSLSDSVTLSELITKSPSKRLSDSITLSDNLSKSLTVTVVDTVSIGDSSTASQGGKSASLSDTVIVTDAIVKKVISTYKNDAVNLSDVDNHTAAKNLFDSITLTDTISKSNGKSIILSDSITVTDAIFKAVNVIKSDSITLADSTSKTAKIGVYDVLITSDDLSILNPQAPEIIGTIHLKGSRTLNVYLVGSQILNVNLKGGIS